MPPAVGGACRSAIEGAWRVFFILVTSSSIPRDSASACRSARERSLPFCPYALTEA